MTWDRSRVVLVVSFAATGCGAIGEANPPPPIPPGATGPFGDASPIEVCVGSARVSASATGLGACVASNEHAASCDDDSTCKGLERCVCGRCIVEVCAGATSCGDGQVCRNNRCTSECGSDADCGGDKCVVGGCAKACTKDSECSFGERCDPLNQACGVESCSAQIPCGFGDTCESAESYGLLREPDVVTSDDGSALAFFEIDTAKGTSIYRARVDATNRWTADPATPVLANAAGPSVVGEGASLDLYFADPSGLGVFHAVSTDGGASFADPKPILMPEEKWEGGYVGSPSVAAFGGARVLFYEGGPRAGIGAAILDGDDATRVSSAPVLSAATIEDPVLWRDVSDVSSPFAIASADGATLLVYFAARGAEGGDAISNGQDLPADTNDSIGLAATSDLATFRPFAGGPVFAEVANLRAYLGEREPSIRFLDSGAELTFVATDASGANESGLARAAR